MTSVLIYFENVLETKRILQHFLFTSRPFGLFFLGVVGFVTYLTNFKKFVIIYIKKVKNALNLIIEYLGEERLIIVPRISVGHHSDTKDTLYLNEPSKVVRLMLDKDSSKRQGYVLTLSHIKVSVDRAP